MSMFGPVGAGQREPHGVDAGVERDLLGDDLPGRPGAGGIEGERGLSTTAIHAQLERPIGGRAVRVAEIERVQAGLRRR